jgi:hypothetical protein
LPVTVFGVAMAMERNPEGRCDDCGRPRDREPRLALAELQPVDEKTEREHIARAVSSIEKLTGQRPVGGTRGGTVQRAGSWSSARLSRRGLVWDDLPYWQSVSGRDHLVIPHTLRLQ